MSTSRSRALPVSRFAEPPASRTRAITRVRSRRFVPCSRRALTSSAVSFRRGSYSTRGSALSAVRSVGLSFKRVEDAAVEAAIRLQAGVGLAVVADGEMRPLSLQSQFAEAVEGFSGWDLDAFLWVTGTVTRSGTSVSSGPPIAVLGRLRRRRFPLCPLVRICVRLDAADRQGHAAESKSVRQLLRSAAFTRRLSDPEALPGRRPGDGAPVLG